MSSFLPVKPCCVTHPGELPGTPRGSMEPARQGKMGRYIVKPDGPVKNEKAALILLYDAMGFQASNPKIIADAFATQLGITVIVPDYIPNAPPPTWFDSTLEQYPGQHAGKSWLATIWDYLSLISKIVWKLPGLLTGSTLPLVKQAVEEARAEGYERLGAIGYCRGGSMVIHLLTQGDDSPLTCGIVCHPAPEKGYGHITRPSLWHFADHDMVFKDKHIADVRQALEGKNVVFEHTIYEQTMHGFAARPALSHPPTAKAFEEANKASVKFLRKHLGL